MNCPLFEEVCASYAEASKQNQARVDFFLQFLEECSRSGIQILPLKGLDLILRAYPALGLRPMVDMDFLIRPSDIPRVRSLLEQKGFRRKNDFMALCYYLPGALLDCDIIWDIWYLPSTEALWPRVIHRVYGDREISLMHPEDALLYLVAYVVAHRGVISPVFAQDLDYFLEAEGGRMDWDRWVSRAKGLKLQPAVYYGLIAARDLGMNRVPEAVYEALKPRSLVHKAIVRIYSRLATEEAQPKVSYLYTWLEYPGLGGKLKLLRQKLLPTKLEVELWFGLAPSRAYGVFVLMRPFYLVLRAFYFILSDSVFLIRRFGRGRAGRRLRERM